MTWNTLIVTIEGPVGIVRLNRPAAMNALNAEMTSELSHALDAFEDDPAIGAIVLTGGDTVFAAGADIKELRDKTFADVYGEQLITRSWERAARCRKPVIAAVAGHAIGGGCELALMADIIVADETARLALPETRIGTIPGAGGTQRLTRIVGKAVAMDMILTGRPMPADEALARGVVSRVVPAGRHLAEAVEIAARLATLSRPVLMLAKEAVNQAHETHLAEGIYVERRLLYSTFATEDRREGMTAFAEKRKPAFTHR
ncbi:MAG: enoyl-CoA hydratase-related protein [Gemmobacter sp.]|nr:enoyl-CoA hydratase-related protein [Gemmobacter sp.]